MDVSVVGLLAPCSRVGCRSHAWYRVQDPRYRAPTSLYLCRIHLDELGRLLGKELDIPAAGPRPREED